MRSLLLLLSCLALGLSACAVGGDPQPMGRGYTAYHDKYKSAPGANAHDVGYEFKTETNKTVLTDMRYAATDLVNKLDKNLTFSEDKIFLARPFSSAFYNSFDHLLRDELVRSGFTLAQTPADAVTITFVAQESSEMSGKVKSPYRKLYLALLVGGKAHAPATHVSGFYEVPAYDFEPTGPVMLRELKEPRKNYTAPLQRLITDD